MQKQTQKQTSLADFDNKTSNMTGNRHKNRHGTGQSSTNVEFKSITYRRGNDRSFSDGNKRIAATLFFWLLNNNGILYRLDGSKRLADNTLVALPRLDNSLFKRGEFDPFG